jgi:hypothetical protein
VVFASSEVSMPTTYHFYAEGCGGRVHKLESCSWVVESRAQRAGERLHIEKFMSETDGEALFKTLENSNA